ncbi:MAG: hypothetical protein Q8R18_02890 [bacterium]|nr:hypothetical protein [bacterium]
MVSLVSTAYLIGKVMGDGHLEKTLGSCYFISGDEKQLLLLKKFIIQEFEINKDKFSLKKYFTKKGISYKLRISSVNFCKFLFSHDAPKGRKVEQAFFVPIWILDHKNFQKAFLQGILEDELTTIKIEKSSHSVAIQFKMSKIKNLYSEHEVFMMQIKNLLENFSIECGELRFQENKEDLSKFRFYFHIQRNKRNLIRFKENIGFCLNIQKSQELEKTYQILKKTLRPEVNKTEILIFRQSGLSIRQIASKTNISSTHVHRILQKFN